MQKQSKYIVPLCDNRSSTNNQRRADLMSLPRLSWLDRQPDYDPWPETEPPHVEPRPIEPQKRKNGRFASSPSDVMSKAQIKVWEMHMADISIAEIARRVGKSPNAVSKLLCAARHKQGIGLK